MNIECSYKETNMLLRINKEEDNPMDISWNKDKIIDFKDVKYGEAFVLLQDMQNVWHPLFPQVMIKIGESEVGTYDIIPFHDCYNSVCLKTGAVCAISEDTRCLMVQQSTYVSL